MANYWQTRMAKSQDVISQKNLKQIERILRKYYRTVAQGVIDDFEATYNKVLATIEEGRQATPADLYKLDKYWQMQGQLDARLKKLNDWQQRKLLRAFRKNFTDVYNSIAISGLSAYSTIDDDVILQVINQIWVADGKSWSQRIWDNTNHLKQTLNEELIHCVVSGKPPSALKKILQERFDVSFNRADSLVRTELAHVQTQAAKQRYRDYGIEQVEVLADKDERRCEVCGKLHGKRYYLTDAIPIPAHPKCRCCLIPVVTDEQL